MNPSSHRKTHFTTVRLNKITEQLYQINQAKRRKLESIKKLIIQTDLSSEETLSEPYDLFFV